jgi:hypothetical protein
MIRRDIFLIITAISLIASSGCGYTTRSVMAVDNPSLHVQNFANKIDVTRETSDENTYYAYKPAMESDITRNVIERFIFDGNYRIESPEDAAYLLKGDLVEFRREPLGYDANDNITEYRLSVAVDMELRDLETNELLWQESHFAGESTYRTGGEFSKDESTALDEAILDLARRIVERTVENW